MKKIITMAFVATIAVSIFSSRTLKAEEIEQTSEDSWGRGFICEYTVYDQVYRGIGPTRRAALIRAEEKCTQFEHSPTPGLPTDQVCRFSGCWRAAE